MPVHLSSREDLQRFVDELPDDSLLIFDMDGTLWIGNTVLVGVHEAFAVLRARGVRFAFCELALCPQKFTEISQALTTLQLRERATSTNSSGSASIGLRRSRSSRVDMPRRRGSSATFFLRYRWTVSVFMCGFRLDLRRYLPDFTQNRSERAVRKSCVPAQSSAYARAVRRSSKPKVSTFAAARCELASLFLTRIKETEKRTGS